MRLILRYGNENGMISNRPQFDIWEEHNLLLITIFGLERPATDNKTIN